ncbi:hypothetical protein [Streptomyces mutabilis]|uniref:Uncharacterized protein n=1 Tax=Streptomyces mutabilis TaxID=67332 RepID=A0A086MTB7_9ACTN|nr:hypothetical protein [Streptomyces mutabilis]KFG72135.1 hypothetical protein FM21_28570 [Streptomyces mutabilis]
MTPTLLLDLFVTGVSAHRPARGSDPEYDDPKDHRTALTVRAQEGGDDAKGGHRRPEQALRQPLGPGVAAPWRALPAA